MHFSLSRRRFLSGSLAAGFGYSVAEALDRDSSGHEDKALIAITLDLEMSRNFPTWEQTHWDYEKGNLDDSTKKYAVEAARRVKAKGGVLHFFAVGHTLEQENVDWLREIIREGHPIGNHTYDHVNIRANRPADIQFRFQRAPWLIEGKKTAEIIADNIRMTNVALKTRLGIDAAGFRTPGGFFDGLSERPDLQSMLLSQGFAWVSSKYPPHAMGKTGTEPAQANLDAIVRAQEQAQPFVYPSGLIEVPMSPISDIGAFRGGRWKLASFLKAIRLGVEWALEHRAVFDFLGHPSCLVATDPTFQTVDLICDLVRQAGKQAAIVDLGTIARRAMRKKKGRG